MYKSLLPLILTPPNSLQQADFLAAASREDSEKGRVPFSSLVRQGGNSVPPAPARFTPHGGLVQMHLSAHAEFLSIVRTSSSKHFSAGLRHGEADGNPAQNECNSKGHENAYLLRPSTGIFCERF